MTSVAYRGICPHCYLAIDGEVRYRRHVERCPQNPPVAWKLIAFLHEHATDGVIMTSRSYYAMSHAAGLPCWKLLAKVLGGWGEVAEWAGLKLRDSHYGPMTPRQQMPVLPTVAEYDACLPTGGLEAASVRIVGKRAYYMLR